MSAIHDLIAQVSDPRLRERLAAEWASASKEKKFGLVFEDHLPERLPLPKARPRRGDLVCRRAGPLKDVWRVLRVRDGVATCVRPGAEPHATQTNPSATETVDMAVDELLVVREFGEPIFPSLVPMDAVQNGDPAGPWHTLIEADNYHALQLLDYLYAGRVDCIYIDPPYNTGARDWKYNNDYVDANDQWRHSKWLAMMQRRLRLAKKLLNPADSVLIVTIDEHEVHHLGMLLEQEFPEAQVQMVTSVINHSGVARAKAFYRADEYLFFVFLGAAAVVPNGRDMLNEAEPGTDTRIDIWNRLLRRGTGARRQDSPNLFYAFWVDPVARRIHSVGDPIPLGQSRESVAPPAPGLVACWPIRSDGTEGRWQISAETARKGLAEGTVRLGAYTRTRERWSISYLRNAEKERIQRGEIEVLGRDENGALILRFAEDVQRVKNPVTVWNQRSHNAGAGGSNLLRALLPGRRFPFPKSLYAVEDALRFFVANKPEALIVDFFAGSGTTAHAVLRLNREDGGRRRCILVTNNEVSAEDAASLREQGFQPGDPEWDAYGICRQITFPRLRAAITGKTDDGQAVKGEYKFNLTYPIAEGFAANLAYFKLDFLDPERVSLRRAFREILPLLWLKAGAVGPRPELARNEPEPVLFAPEGSNFVVLLDETRMGRLLQAIGGRTGLSHVFIVTDADESFKTMAQEVRDAAGRGNPGLQVVQLYRDYLLNFMINQGGAK
ncbi:MAG: site-specific DNA-methyltransferase [Tepidimonas sp.]|uniref:site-specific DNA-methyltransferase n=1 Tax=Tepidimonas sp. TaxID=2002775 RepID=UPI00259F77EB|nr:site-specific DNA-methyltransferase [Tepidimonas sp.]MDM7456056.1 site-specific DNA-methyltransferase [Tepidimonas sp.]